MGTCVKVIYVRGKVVTFIGENPVLCHLKGHKNAVGGNLGKQTMPTGPGARRTTETEDVGAGCSWGNGRATPGGLDEGSRAGPVPGKVIG